MRQQVRWDRLWDESLAALVDWSRINGHCYPSPRTTHAGKSIGTWVVGLRASHRGSAGATVTLTPERVKQIEDAFPAWRWDWGHNEYQWWETYARLLTWVDRVGSAAVPVDIDDGRPGTPLGHWTRRQKSRYTRGVLSEDRALLLASVPGWSWDGDQRLIAGRSYKEVALAAELQAILGEDTTQHRVRTERGMEHCDVVLPASQVIVEYDGRYWHASSEARDVAKSDRLSRAGWFVVRIREDPLPMLSLSDRAVSATGSNLDVVLAALSSLRDLSVISSQRHAALVRHARMRAVDDATSRVATLARDDEWRVKYEALEAFQAATGHALVPATYVAANGVRLGEWVYLQRKFERQGRMRPERKRLLDVVPGWEWNPKAGGIGRLRRALPGDAPGIVQNGVVKYWPVS